MKSKVFTYSIYAPLVLSIALLSACASSGSSALKSATQQSLSTTLVKGKTTREQVRTQFGKPDVEAVSADGGDVLRYNYSASSPKLISLIPIVGGVMGGSDVSKKELVIYLDGKGIVNNYTLNETKTQTTTKTENSGSARDGGGVVGSLTRPVGAGTLPGRAVNIPDAPAMPSSTNTPKVPIVPIDPSTPNTPNKVDIPVTK